MVMTDHDDGVVSSLNRSRVLVIDDEPANVSLLRRILATAGLTHVRGVTDPRDALSTCSAWHPDLVILDLHMPYVDGFDLLESIRPAEHSTDFLPVLVLTADTTHEALTRALAAGANDFLVKPVEATEVILRVRNLLSVRVCHEELKHRNSALAAELRAVTRDSPTVRQERIELRDRIRGLIASGEPGCALQPIVNLTTGEVFAHEALARFALTPDQPPTYWFSRAAACGMVTELEIAALAAAIDRLEDLPDHQLLAVNVSPATLMAATARQLLLHQPLDRLALEITEHQPVDDYGALLAAVEELRAHGALISIDDAGAGYSSLQHILKLWPDVIKLDMTLTRGVDHDPIRRALASALVSFASDIGATLVAEGIETMSELEALRGLGVTYGQGYHLGRPADHLVASPVQLRGPAPQLSPAGDPGRGIPHHQRS